MKRGNVVAVAAAGDFGKPRPAVVIQADLLTQTETDTILVCLLTSEIRNVRLRRIAVEPTLENGLLKPSQIMVEKIFAIRRDKCGDVIGSLEPAVMSALDEALIFVVGLISDD